MFENIMLVYQVVAGLFVAVLVMVSLWTIWKVKQKERRERLKNDIKRELRNEL